MVSRSRGALWGYRKRSGDLRGTDQGGVRPVGKSFLIGILSVIKTQEGLLRIYQATGEEPHEGSH